MASIALTSLIKTIELEFLQPAPRVGELSLHDRAGINSFLASLSSLLALLQMESSGDAVRVRDLEIEIRDFALKAEDHIEIQLSNFLLAQHTGIRPKKKMKIPGQPSDDYMCFRATYELLHQTLGEAATNATDLLKILTREKESCVSEKEMASVALINLIPKLRYHFLQPFPTVYLGDEAESFLWKLNSLQRNSNGGAAAIKIRNFALETESDIEIQLSDFLLAKHTQHEGEVSQRLRQTLREAAKIAAEFLNIIFKEEQHERERETTFAALTSLMETIDDDKAGIKSTLLENLSSLQLFLRQQLSGGCATTKDKDLETEIRNFALKAKHDIEIQLNNFSQEKDSRGLHQTLQEATSKATKLLNILTKQEENGRELASDALNTFMTKFYYDFLHPNPIVPLDNRAAMTSFFQNLSSLQDHLESSGAATINDLETEIRSFVLTAGDDIETQVKNLVQAKDDTDYQQKTSQLNQTVQEAAGRAAKLLKIINSRSNEVDEANETQPSNTWLKHAASKSANVEFDGSLHRFLKPEGRMVGRHHDCRVINDQLFSSRHHDCRVIKDQLFASRHHYFRLIKDQLFSSRNKRKIISIVGMVGIGKTTLARNVYEDPSVASHFDVRGWVTMAQDNNKSGMLSQLLQSITPEEPNVIKKGSTPHELEMQVRKCLRGRKYLIVLDNIMSNKAMTCIRQCVRQCVPDDIDGSCILLTTRHFNRYDYWNSYIHYMTLLGPKESWELFCNILSIEEHLAPKFEKIRTHVVEKCDGLPQLIVEVAKRLSKCNNIQQGWKKIEKELESLGILDRNSITVSYNILPHHLKVCFLYFGVFPKRKKILVKMLIRSWIGEGFVKPEPLNHNELEDEAYKCLQELTDRSLLLIEDQSSEGKIKSCRMHSALHSFCVGETQKEGILCTINTQQHPRLPLKEFANSCRWLSFYSHSFDYYVLFGTNIPRSIFFFHKNPKMFVPLKLLKVLAFDSSISLQRVPMQLGDLVFLRYLSITQWFLDLDDVVSNNPNLETLVVSGNGAPTVHLPSSIWKPPHLRHLELGNSYLVDPPSADKKNLQTLCWVVRPLHCRKKVYSKFPNIKNLKIFLKDDIEPNHIGGCCSNPIILDHFDYFKWLKKLSISVSFGCNVALPELARFPSGLKKLKLSGTNISEGDLNVIAKLPNLMVLKLENAFHGIVWEVAQKGFCNLRYLLIEAKELKQWVVSSSDDFINLRHLVLRSCNCLEQMPKDFIGYQLESIELEGCLSSLVASAKQLQQKRISMDFSSLNGNLEIKTLHCKSPKSMYRSVYTRQLGQSHTFRRRLVVRKI
ncbi:putative late blight resistance protein homolog R1A-4 [Ipomoea triloba]|uniref:putative late blight resistance protein homolog R1A-4 n=1 Tax=Ipomoea triloba TaxID=35885 RepID=UPI00125E5DA1|nr:putative late blight resistance protein homolog R1A-4 [Ipomoea triloba]